jgi:hypothetical protein
METVTAYDGKAPWIAAAWALGDGAGFFWVIGGFLPHLTVGRPVRLFGK